MQKFSERILELLKSRVLLLFIFVALLFSILAFRLFSLQIVNGETYQQELTTSIMRKLTIPASRGNIYDRYGRPLATNLVAFSVKIDDSIKTDFSSNRGDILSSLITNLNGTENEVQDTLPITSSMPYKFTINAEEEKKWKESIGMSKKELEFSAEETLNYLYKKYQVSDTLSESDKRKIVSLGISTTDKNLMLLSLIEILRSNGETIVDDLPISQTEPSDFLFDGNKNKEIEWKKSISMKETQYGCSAEQALTYLKDLFDIPSCISDSYQRNLIAIRYALYLERYRKYQPVTVALDISDKTVANIEENQSYFPGVTIDTDSLRYYNSGKYFSHILGYIRKISDEEYTENKDKGYTQSDLFGKSGIEKVKEFDLRGTDGEMLVEVDSVGRRINTIETKAPVSGKNVFLTLDKDLQQAAYDSLENALKDVIKLKLTGSAKSDHPITLKQLFSAMVNGEFISVKKICSASDGVQKEILDYVRSQNPSLDYSNADDLKEAKQIVMNGIDDGSITSTQMVLTLFEQEKLSGDEEYLNSIRSGRLSPLSVILQKLDSGELKPSDTKIDPCTGSVVVSDVNTGSVLALVSYPSYDNNEFVNNFNNEYYNSLLLDTTSPLVNRPLVERKAPGSTLKMVTALAGLETGTITDTTLIKDQGTFTKAGIPYARCWIGSGRGSHGYINVSHALEVSCNYFFYELAYRLGNSTEDSTLEGITTLNDYMAAFGLNSPSGIEIGEADPCMASPQYKEEVIKLQNPDATVSQTRWTDGDTIRAAIGQSVNNYAPIHMNKYVATLANGGTRYSMHLLDKVENADGTLDQQSAPVVENILELQEENLEAVFEGMRLVTSGEKGTLKKVFHDFPVTVAAKSGTAQENLNKSSHTWFVGFAPYEKPQISVTVMIPFGECSTSPAAQVAKDVIAEYMGLNYEPENSYMKNELAE
ncbi:MAG: hypothetical protein KHZ62_06445 [Clostridiales bacterium]|nr:hypothetical protein [Clostridiales bacterium]